MEAQVVRAVRVAAVECARPIVAPRTSVAETTVPPETSGRQEQRRAVDVAREQATFHTISRGPLCGAIIYQLLNLGF